MTENKIQNTMLNKQASTPIIKNATPIIKNATPVIKNAKPIWLMRQAGRYLPEYRNIRQQAGSFLQLCYNPELATQVTLQPIQRFGFDAAIIFSDILLIPQAMGQKLEFIENEGPKLEKITSLDEILALSSEQISTFLSPVYSAISLTRKELATNKSLIGFAGGAWTIATYMLEGGANRDFIASKILALNNPEILQQLINKLVSCISTHLINQVEAGADLLQIFDSWAGVLTNEEFIKWVIRPTTEIISRVKAKYPHIRIIGFPRGASFQYKAYAEQSGADIVNIDSMVPLAWAKAHLQDKVMLQGNLDPITLLSNKQVIKEQVGKIFEGLGSKNFIFNLGHGILPATPIEHVEFLVETVREQAK